MELSYTLIRSRRKTLAIQITPKGEVLVRCPVRFSEKQALIFVKEKEGWILKQLERIAARPELPLLTPEELKDLAEQLRPVLEKSIAHYASRLDVAYGRVTIRDQRTRWGSCSSKGNLSFNCLLAMAPPEVVDYVVVHELCHRKHMNHSRDFWEAVEKILPDYRVYKKWLKEQGTALLARLPE